MKKLLLGLLLSVNCFAGGKLHLNGNYYTGHGKTLPTAGISVWEYLGLGIFYDGYYGVGISPREAMPNVYWLVNRHDIGTYFGPVGVSVGATVRLSEQEFIGTEDESNVHLKLSYELW